MSLFIPLYESTNSTINQNVITSLEKIGRLSIKHGSAFEQSEVTIDGIINEELI